jgi:hypothetical protein
MPSPHSVEFFTGGQDVDTTGYSPIVDSDTGNHQVIGTSENYSSASSRDNGIGAFGRAAVGAKVSDLSTGD